MTVTLAPGWHDYHHVCDVHGVLVDVRRDPYSGRWRARTRYHGQIQLAIGYDLDALATALDTITVAEIARRVGPGTGAPR
ncbi:hypothetical protein J4H86_02470 [Spiractinospora alimapuensis]|uniref:hypothetical protein n=1 Tax=Spiractinospora alimapuensis TaxID=2820884 RepID=UPI001F4033A8|nr:hypothetical protein [Spiractinospora alimapuensis]QVQ52713.1 hypothetical protein J4H86_02470 [Spiractinospora alimapuensis]